MRARDKFEIGDRVIMSVLGMRYCPSGAVSHAGRVVGFSKRDEFVGVLQDGYEFRKTMHMRHWELDAKLIPTWTKNGFVFK